MIKVFVVDDHEVVRRGVADLLDSAEDLLVIGEAATYAQSLARIPALRPDVAVLDIRLPDGNGIELCRELRSRVPDLKCLVLTSFTDEQAMLDAILAGARGYVIKDIDGTRLISAVRDVGAGRSLLDNRAAATLMAKVRADAGRGGPLKELTDREHQLLDLISEGLTNRQISERLHLAEKTVKNYVSRLLTKLGVQRRAQAAALASRLKDGRRGT
ncbi:two-component system, NarL family, response regulator DevR [Amycolatopsis xylanica]|uniref:Two-component system, NarL family, response regulator DevR n=1 Tax=Amycolatopsis xylanica TaxID=589385 RepID=A0A1H3QTC1_9PSEU|nr:response regulator transcription factor [Amycolatopsis xylanica]SDZ16842.1 two-component system, NarL family, response regulator DevR [Amycolatopsis xylanica]